MVLPGSQMNVFTTGGDFTIVQTNKTTSPDSLFSTFGEMTTTTSTHKIFLGKNEIRIDGQIYNTKDFPPLKKVWCKDGTIYWDDKDIFDVINENNIDVTGVFVSEVPSKGVRKVRGKKANEGKKTSESKKKTNSNKPKVDMKPKRKHVDKN